MCKRAYDTEHLRGKKKLSFICGLFRNCFFPQMSQNVPKIRNFSYCVLNTSEVSLAVSDCWRCLSVKERKESRGEGNKCLTDA